MLITRRDFQDSLVYLGRGSTPQGYDHCGICQLPYVPAGRVEATSFPPVQLQCSHISCDGCIQRWTKEWGLNNRQCPSCRKHLWGPTEEEVPSHVPIHHPTYERVRRERTSYNEIAPNRHYLDSLSYDDLRNIFSRFSEQSVRVLRTISLRDPYLGYETCDLRYWERALMRARLPLPGSPAADEFFAQAPITGRASGCAVVHQLCWRAIIKATYKILPVEDGEGRAEETYPESLFNEIVDGAFEELGELQVYWELFRPDLRLEQEFENNSEEVECMLYDEIATIVYFVFYAEELDLNYYMYAHEPHLEEEQILVDQSNAGHEADSDNEGS